MANLQELKTLRDWEASARETMNREAVAYFGAGAGRGHTLKDNEAAFDRYKIRPRMLRDVTSTDTSALILGSHWSLPVGVAPTGLHDLAHQDAEVATARATASVGSAMVLSCVSSKSLEEVASSIPPSTGVSAPRWMQLYLFKDRSLTLRLVRKAEASGYSALVVTVDSPVAGLWKTHLPPSFVVRASRLANLPTTTYKLLDPSATFQNLLWLKEITKLPIVAKGIMTGEDALLAVKYGATAVWVSNHGGRQIDGAVATMDVLEEVVDALKAQEVEVYLDGGVRTGSDVFRALALGARAVFVGRPAVWGLAVAGEEGVKQVLEILKRELLFTMQLTGIRTVQEITRDRVVRSGCSCRL